MPSLLITGAAGFVGCRLLGQIRPGEFERVVRVSRRPASEAGWVEADFPARPVPDRVLKSVDTVVHLAATTGKARSKAYFETNVDGTRSLLEACNRSGVRNFLYVSTIAAKFADQRWYPYAQSKRNAEAVVAAGRLRFAVLRPTLVAGGGAWAGLTRLARLPLTPLFGDGTARLQPIHADDLSEAILTVVREDRFANQTLELGGPDVLSVETLIKRMRHANGRAEHRIAHIPLRVTRRALAAVEAIAGPVLPVTAGQLASFAEDGTAEPNELTRRMTPTMKSIDVMIRESTGE